jgi:hypothetical protein
MDKRYIIIISIVGLLALGMIGIGTGIFLLFPNKHSGSGTQPSTPGSPTSTPGSPTSTPGSPTSGPGSPTSTPGSPTLSPKPAPCTSAPPVVPGATTDCVTGPFPDGKNCVYTPNSGYTCVPTKGTDKDINMTCQSGVWTGLGFGYCDKNCGTPPDVSGWYKRSDKCYEEGLGGDYCWYNLIKDPDPLCGNQVSGNIAQCTGGVWKNLPTAC